MYHNVDVCVEETSCQQRTQHREAQGCPNKKLTRQQAGHISPEDLRPFTIFHNKLQQFIENWVLGRNKLLFFLLIDRADTSAFQSSTFVRASILLEVASDGKGHCYSHQNINCILLHYTLKQMIVRAFIQIVQIRFLLSQVISKKV